jgi:hypothetical protein
MQPGDTLKREPKIGSFAREIRGQEERDSFAQVVKRGMAGRGFRG